MDVKTILSDPWTIGHELYGAICGFVPLGSTILELGSGAGTGALAEKFDMYSVEHKRDYLDLYDSHYIHAWMVDGWYNREQLEGKLPREYAALLVDGPPGEGNRRGLLDNLDLFDLGAWLFFDDLHRESELDVYRKVCDRLGRQCVECSDATKKFGIIARERLVYPAFAERVRALALNVVSDGFSDLSVQQAEVSARLP